jgi:hypothetical protein
MFLYSEFDLKNYAFSIVTNVSIVVQNISGFWGVLIKPYPVNFKAVRQSFRWFSNHY